MTFRWFVYIFVGIAAVGRMIISATPEIQWEYEAFANLLVGFLIIAPFYDRQQLLGPSRLYGILGWALFFWEIGWFIAQKMFK